MIRHAAVRAGHPQSHHREPGYFVGLDMNVDACLTRPGMRTGKHFIEHNSESKEVTCSTDGSAKCLFRRHVS